MEMVKTKDLYHSYEFEGSEKTSLSGVSISVDEGQLVAILGHNGCGKSTLVKHLNGLIPVQKGELTVAGINGTDSANVWKIRRKCGMVFQNPDNQFVSSIVEEDIAFGLENYDVDEKLIPIKTAQALESVGMGGSEKRSPHAMSGGQKQRIAIAGVLAIDPDIIIFDEATAMLDPEGRQEVLDTVKRLHEVNRKTIIMISHYIEEAVFADKVYLIHDGEILASGTPREILTDPVLLRKTGLLPPVSVRAYYDLLESGIKLGKCPLTNDELVEELCLLN